MTHSDLAQAVRRFGAEARVLQVRPVMLPNIPADTPVAHIRDPAGHRPAYVVTERGGRLAGIYQPPVV